jgi:recombination protein RecR
VKDPLASLISLISRLPGIGEKNATRLAYFLLYSRDDYPRELATAIIQAKENIRPCSMCGNFSTQDPCPVCADENRDHSVVMVVEGPQDVSAVEKTGSYKGIYHVLHGKLSPLANKGPEDIKINRLLKRVSEENIREVILALNPDVEGEATTQYLIEKLSSQKVNITRLARGIPVGGALEYLDKDSLEQAIKGRRQADRE